MKVLQKKKIATKHKNWYVYTDEKHLTYAIHDLDSPSRS